MQEPQNRGQHHARRVTPGKISCLSQRRGGEQRTEGHRVLQGRRGGEQGPPCPRLALGAGETSSGWRLAVHGAGSKERAGWAPAEGPRSPGRRPWAPALRQPPLQHRHRLRPWPGCSRTTSLGALQGRCRLPRVGAEGQHLAARCPAQDKAAATWTPWSHVGLRRWKHLGEKTGPWGRSRVWAVLGRGQAEPKTGQVGGTLRGPHQRGPGLM